MDNAAQKVRDWWEVADRTQRMVTIFGAAALVVLLVLTAYVMSQPRMTMLASGLSAQDQTAAVSALTTASIPVDYGPQSSLLVPSDKVDEAKVVIENVGITAKGEDPFSVLTDSGAFENTSIQRERIRVVKERELAKTIMTWSGVSTATVHLNIEERAAFVRSASDQSSATVSITESNAGFGASGGKAVAKLVQNATGIQPENITVVNNHGQLLYQGDLLNQTGSASGLKLQTEIQEARRRERDLARGLDLAFGPGNTIALIQVDLDMDIVQESKTTRTPSTDPYKITETDEGMTVGSDQTSGGGVGVNANPPGGSAPSSNTRSSSPSNYTGAAKEQEFDRNTEQSSTIKAPGALMAMTVQVVVNSAKVTDVKAVESFANAYLGANMGKTGFAATVTAVEFDTEAAKALATSADSMKSSALMQQIISLLPVLALVVVGFLVIRAISKAAAKGRTVYALAPAGASLAQPVQPQYPTGPTPEQISQNLQHEAFQDMPVPETEAGQLLASAIEGGDINDALKIIEDMPEDDEIKAIRARINVPLEQIKHMAKTKPESVAMLLKGWMMEDLR